MSVGKRLVEERERLGLSQAKVYKACGVAKATQYNFENDINLPGGAYLIAAAALGIDVLYVLTGQRSSASTPAPPAPPITEGERTLLKLYNAAPAQVQEGVRTTLGAFQPSADPARQKVKRQRAS